MWNPTPSTATISPKRRRRPRHSSTLSAAMAPPREDTSIARPPRVREGPLVTRPDGLGPPGSEQDLSDGAADAARVGAGLAGDAETDDHLRMRARRQPDPDEIAQLRQLERLAVQGRGHVAGGGAEQDPLQCLPGRHPVGRL